MKKVLLAVAMMAALAGCATKNYGRQGELTEYEKKTLSCREIELETAKVHGYLDHVEKESQFDGRSVLSFLGDFGIGNTMEKSSAIDAAQRRLSQLQLARTNKNCGAEVAAKASE
ncbi:hypothetical protein [Comamonas terrigena]|uniref:hypothetical protein n=1 Tax=Comamonas terrigena TaxID=32013 RepID=UPI00244BB78B|nr:hypothetical protein [Comamonas terrigena]MDH1700301.1 hypothetical protein [Comamonas terrigena]